MTTNSETIRYLRQIQKQVQFVQYLPAIISYPDVGIVHNCGILALSLCLQMSWAFLAPCLLQKMDDPIPSQDVLFSFCFYSNLSARQERCMDSLSSFWKTHLGKFCSIV